MSLTLPNTDLPTNQWVDLYADTGIAVGTAIKVQNLGTSEVYLTVSATEPVIGFDQYALLQRINGVFLRNTTGDPGAWAFSPNQVGKINVSEV